MRDAGAKHKGDGKFRQSHRLSGPIYVDDGFFRPIYVDQCCGSESEIIRMFWLDPNPKKSSDSDTDSDSDTVVG
jgi:hypothetical protein